MGINLWILYYDLLAWHPEIIHPPKPSDCRLTYYSQYSDRVAASESCLYVVKADQLGEVSARNPDGTFLCIGRPDEHSYRAYTSILWFPTPCSLPDLMAQVAECFHRYSAWIHDMETAVYQKKPLDYFGRISLPVIRLPISLFKYNFFCLFSIYDEAYGPVPTSHFPYDQDQYLSSAIMDEISGEDLLSKAISQREPYIFTVSPSDSAACYNLIGGNTHLATLQLDQHPEQITNRDLSLVYILGEMLRRSIVDNSLVNFSMNSDLQKIIFRLLKKEAIDSEKATSALRSANWLPDDAFLCIACASGNTLLPDNALFIQAEAFSRLFPFSLYVIYEHRIVLLINLRHCAPEQYLRSLNQLKKQLVEHHFLAACGNRYNRFEKLSFSYEAAAYALNDAIQTDASSPLIHYEDRLLKRITEELLQNQDRSIYIPDELVALMQYDASHDGDYCKVLRSLLRNNMSCTDTAAELFMHRNTVLNRMNRMKEHFHIPLDDYDCRLQLTIAFLLLEQ